jgi:apolipoprotein D and lipocalin family protein
LGQWYEIASFPSRFQPKNGENPMTTFPNCLK